MTKRRTKDTDGLTGDLFGSLKCDCGDQLRRGLRTLKELGGGILLYLDQEGRGTGIAAKMRAYGYQHEGLDTIDADQIDDIMAGKPPRPPKQSQFKGPDSSEAPPDAAPSATAAA